MRPETQSQAMRLLHLVYDTVEASRRRSGYALSHAMESAIAGHIRFGADDLILASKHPDEGGICLRRYLGETCEERWYSQAVETGHKTAMRAIERWIGRPRFLYDGKVLHAGARFHLPDAISEDNRSGWVEVTSFSDDGRFVNVRAHGESLYRKCPECGGYAKTKPEEAAADPTTKRRRQFRLAFRDLDRQERARQKVLGMAFEAEGEEPPLREYSGKLIAEQCRRALPEIARIEMGRAIVVTPDVPGTAPLTLRRIGYLSHDLLKDTEREALDYQQLHDQASTLGAMVRDGLLAQGPHQYGSPSYVLTEAGRTRLRALSSAAERSALDDRQAAAERIEEEAVRRRAEQVACNAHWVAARLAEYTEADLAAVVSVEDSIAAGNCRAGTSRWIAEHAPGAKSMTVRELIELDGGQNDMNVRALIRAGLARASRTGDRHEGTMGL